MAISWFPTTIGGILLFLILLMAVSWWLTGRLSGNRLDNPDFPGDDVGACLCLHRLASRIADGVDSPRAVGPGFGTQAEKEPALRRTCTVGGAGSL